MSELDPSGPEAWGAFIKLYGLMCGIGLVAGFLVAFFARP